MKKNIMNFTKYLFVLSIFYIFIYRFYLINIPSLIPYAYEIGDIIYQFSFAYSVSFVFYVIVTLIPKQSDKKNVYYYIDGRIEIILYLYNEFLPVAFNDQTNDIDTLSTENLNKKIIKHYTKMSFFITFPAPIQEELIYLIFHTRKCISDIFIMIPYLETNHIRLLTSLQDSSFLNLKTEKDNIQIPIVYWIQYHELLKKLKKEWPVENQLPKPPS